MKLEVESPLESSRTALVAVLVAVELETRRRLRSEFSPSFRLANYTEFMAGR